MRSVTIGKSGIVALVGLLVAGPVAAWATPNPPVPISITNPDFTGGTLAQASGNNGSQDYWYQGSFSGWTASGSYVGWFHPSTAEFPGGGNYSTPATGIPAGSYVAWVNNGTSLKSIFLPVLLQSNAQYVLTFAVGQRGDAYGVVPNYSVGFYSGSSIIYSKPNPVAVIAGQFVTGSTTFDTQTQNDPHADQSFGIVLAVLGGQLSQADFNGLSLTVVTNLNPIPEPTTGGLLGLGVLILGLVSARRRQVLSQPVL